MQLLAFYMCESRRDNNRKRADDQLEKLRDALLLPASAVVLPGLSADDVHFTLYTFSVQNFRILYQMFYVVV